MPYSKTENPMATGPVAVWEGEIHRCIMFPAPRVELAHPMDLVVMAFKNLHSACEELSAALRG